ncbi:nickel pincer cofactor biosynthesis protein LarC [Alkaliphilus crotonatoxidans]
MKILYFDCFSGISGDMFLGAMLDIGVPEETLRQGLDKLQLPGYSLEVFTDQRRGITGTRVNVQLLHDHSHGHHHKDDHHDHVHHHQHRNLYDIKKIINQSQLSQAVKEMSITIFTHIAEAEAKIHGKSLEEVHFHEVGAIDSIVDIVGAAICIHALPVDKILFSTVAVGSGFVNCAHGRFPVPAPATAELLRGIKITSGEVEKELTTPTGAAIVKALADEIIDHKDFTIERIGYGIGERDNPVPNVLRVYLGEIDYSNDEPVKEVPLNKVIECNIDDSNPEIYPYVMERLLEAGAMDAWLTPIVMKKGRSATTLTVLCDRNHLDTMVDIIFEETTTIGVRTYDVSKVMMDRRIVTLETPYGPVSYKSVFHNGREIKFKPEFEDCKRIALDYKLPINQVYETLRDIYRKRT